MPLLAVILVLLAGFFNVIAVNSLKTSEGMTKWKESATLVASIIACQFFLSRAMLLGGSMGAVLGGVVCCVLVSATIIGWKGHGEVPTAWHWFGLTLTVVGVFITNVAGGGKGNG